MANQADLFSDGVNQILTQELHKYLCKKCKKDNCDYDCPSLEMYDILTEKMSNEVVEFVKKRSKTLYMLEKFSKAK